MDGLPKDYYTQQMKALSLKRKGNGYTLHLDFTPIGKNLDRAQDALDAQVWKDVQNYMPLRSGALKSETNERNANARGKVYLYPPNSDYGHYQYEGVLYVDPKTGKGAFYNPTYGFLSRPKKVPSNKKLTYSQPNATAKWGETAINNHYEKWVNLVKRELS